MHIWLDLLKNNYHDRLKGIKISRSNYVRRQVYHWYMQYKSKGISFRELKNRLRVLTPFDSLGLFLFIFDRESWVRLLRMVSLRKNNKVQKGWYGLVPVEHVTNIKDFRAWVGTQRISK